MPSIPPVRAALLLGLAALVAGCSKHARIEVPCGVSASCGFPSQPDPTAPRQSAPVAVAGRLAFKAVAVGARHACDLTGAGAASCWGEDRGGTLGIGR